MLSLIVLGDVMLFAGGCVTGALCYYAYANHMYTKHPELFKARLEQKIQRLRGTTDERN